MRNVTLVWSVLVACQAAAPPVAQVPSDDVPRTSDEHEPHIDDQTMTESSVSNDSRPAGDETPEPVEAPPPPLPSGTTILHVGSSNAEALGLDLRRELEPYGIKYVLEAKESTYIPEWAGEKMGLRRLIVAHDPDLVLVTLGGNEVGIPDPTIRAEAIRRLVKVIGDRPCVWIGTPKWKAIKHNAIHEVIRENCAACLYLDTDALVPDLKPHSDGVHPTLPERRRWARAVKRWLEHNRNPNGARPWDFKSHIELPP